MKKIYIIGSVIKESKSPIIHNYWLKKYSINAKYKIKELEPYQLINFIKTFDKNKCLGFNVTMPYKKIIFDLVNNHSNLVNKISATNTISWKKNKLFADNTDGYGFYKNLIISSGWSNLNRPVIIYGAGGASRAIIQVIKDAGAKYIYLYNRTLLHALKILKDLNIKATIIDNNDDKEKYLSNAGLFINTTSLGTNNLTSIDIDLSLMPKDAIVADIVYTPLETILLKRAKNIGLKTVDGLGMLLHQAAKSFEIWFQILPKVDILLRNFIIKNIIKNKNV